MKNSIFFDLDGTLTDPKIGITRSIRFALEQLDVEIAEEEDLTWCIGPPLLTSFEKLLDSQRASTALLHYRERFAEVGWQENHVYPGIAVALEALEDSGARLYVATSKPEVFARRIVDFFELGQYLTGVFGSGLDGTRSEKADLLRFALDQTGSDATSVMIGDRQYDVRGALCNNMRAIGVTWGYGSRQELWEAGAREFADQPEDLLPLLR